MDSPTLRDTYVLSNTPLEGSKKKMSLSIDEALSKKAKQLGLNLSREAERGILQAVKRNGDSQWLQHNAAAISAYNERIEAEGLFGDEFRTF